jgi:putative ABC transport system substrate-binding protein
MLRRRQAFALGAALLACVAAAFGQSRVHRIGFLGGTTPDASVRRNAIEPFLQGLREHGHIEGENIEIRYGWAEGEPDRLPALAAQLLALDLDLLVAIGPGPALTARKATRTVPVVALAVDNPVEMGLAADYARPGGNVTGISSYSGELVAKRLQLLKELVPSVQRVAVLANPRTAGRAQLERALQRFGPSLGLSMQLVEAPGPEQFEAAFADMKRERADGVLVLADATFWTHRARLHELVERHRLPSVWGHRDYLEGGGLASYQSDFPALFRRGGALVAHILKGARPADTPFEQATKLDLAINLKAAQAMGITVPPALLIAADHVIR